MVEVMSTTKPMYGLIKWIGHLPDQKDPTKLIAGLEMVRNLEDHTTRAKVINLFFFILKSTEFIPLINDKMSIINDANNC